jgi:hypothetical protein
MNCSKTRRGFVPKKVVLGLLYGTTKPGDIPRWLPNLKPVVDLRCLRARVHHFAYIDVR